MPYVLCYNDRHQSIPLAIVEQEPEIIIKLAEIIKSAPIKELEPFKDTVFHTWSSRMNSGIVPWTKYILYKNVTILVLNDKNCQTMFVTQIP
jgi:hypothetical protein